MAVNLCKMHIKAVQNALYLLEYWCVGDGCGRGGCPHSSPHCFCISVCICISSICISFIRNFVFLISASINFIAAVCFGLVANKIATDSRHLRLCLLYVATHSRVLYNGGNSKSQTIIQHFLPNAQCDTHQAHLS